MEGAGGRPKPSWEDAFLPLQLWYNNCFEVSNQKLNAFLIKFNGFNKKWGYIKQAEPVSCSVLVLV